MAHAEGEEALTGLMRPRETGSSMRAAGHRSRGLLQERWAMERAVGRQRALEAEPGPAVQAAPQEQREAVRMAYAEDEEPLTESARSS
jgi:hypothetical protein